MDVTGAPLPLQQIELQVGVAPVDGLHGGPGLVGEGSAAQVSVDDDARGIDDGTQGGLKHQPGQPQNRFHQFLIGGRCLPPGDGGTGGLQRLPGQFCDNFRRGTIAQDAQAPLGQEAVDAGQGPIRVLGGQG